MIKNKLILLLILINATALAQPKHQWSASDSLHGEALIKTIEQSLDLFYAENSPNGDYNKIIAELNYEPNDIPEYSNAIYCERLRAMNEMSPFQLECNEATLSTIRFFVNKRRGFARVVLGRSELYFELFERKLIEHGLPIELKYLAVIESGLRPQVKSRAGALGLWQFMYATGRMFGLEENSYIDERMDPELATDAACLYLKKLHAIYNDWNLALAAYNAGPGNVNKAIRRSGNKVNYWQVRPFLPKETQGYVPNFIAAAYLLTYHAEHNIIPMEAKVKYAQLDTMCLNKGVHFSTIAELLKIEEADVAELNPIYKRAYIPYSAGKKYCVTLPLAKIGSLVSLEDSLYALELARYSQNPVIPKDTASVIPDTSSTPQPAIVFTHHLVKEGETLLSIASRYGMTVSEVQEINGLNSTKIYVGQRLKVRTVQESIQPDPVTPITPTAQKQYYTVRTGDTFGKIAQRHRLSISQLSKLNPGVNVNRISVGQRLRVK